MNQVNNNGTESSRRQQEKTPSKIRKIHLVKKRQSLNGAGNGHSLTATVTPKKSRPTDSLLKPPQIDIATMCLIESLESA